MPAISKSSIGLHPNAIRRVEGLANICKIAPITRSIFDAD